MYNPKFSDWANIHNEYDRTLIQYTGMHHLSPEASRRRIAMASLPPTCTTPVRHSHIVLKPYIYISVSETHKAAIVEARFICKPVEQAVAGF